MTLHDSCLASVLFNHFSVDHPLRAARHKHGQDAIQIDFLIVHYDVTRRGRVTAIWHDDSTGLYHSVRRFLYYLRYWNTHASVFFSICICMVGVFFFLFLPLGKQKCIFALIVFYSLEQMNESRVVVDRWR